MARAPASPTDSGTSLLRGPAGHWDAGGDAIINVADPIDPGDVATKGFVDTRPTLTLPELTVATLPAGSAIGTLANVSDSTTATPGATVAAGGALHVLVRWSGTVWKVVA